MQDFLILTRRASEQFRKILCWEDAQEYSLRRILIGCLKDAYVITVSGVEPIREFTYRVDLNTKWVHKDILIKMTRNSNKMSPDGKMPCAFVTNIETLEPQVIRAK